MATPWPAPATVYDDDEADRQMILLALAELSLRRPGWERTLERLAGRLHGKADFAAFKETSRQERTYLIDNIKVT